MPQNKFSMVCTLTGAADDIDPIELLTLSKQFPFVEWGVLFCETHAGQGRFASHEWIGSLQALMAANSELVCSLHLCGRRTLEEFIAGTEDMQALTKGFSRIQLNLHAKAFLVEDLRAAIVREAPRQVITQHNSANADLWQNLTGVDNHAVLFDSSGGRGKLPDDWPSPLPGVECGYAGGLGPDNILPELVRIMLSSGGLAAWVDMEGKLRTTEDTFDLSLALHCLEKIDTHALNSSHYRRA